jgi:hypothetical protein
MSQPTAHPLIVLCITLTFWEADPQVELVLFRGTEVTNNSRPMWRVPVSSIGVPASLEPNTERSLVLPEQVVEELQASLQNEPKTLPLWLRFAKPHGYLGVLPWVFA